MPIYQIDGSNIQDHAIIRGYLQQDTVVEEYGHIGHSAILHACQIGRNVLIGMNSVIMDSAEIGENSIVGAMAFAKVGATFGTNKLIIGSPVRGLRDLTEQELEWKHASTREYQELVTRCKNRIRP
ncbi:hypothetical protein ID853_10250 [Xenorhabdus sp. Vera]|nr:hypothetical protein [Xenorhabdus sp. Vera]